MNNNPSLKKNAVLNVVKQSCNIVFPLITYPYVSRVLLSANLGRYSFADSIINIAMTFAGLGISTYGLREGARIRSDKRKLDEFASEIFTINFIAMILVYSVLIICTLFVGRLRRDYILIFILSLNIITSVLGRDWINQIFEDFTYISLRYIFFQTIAVVLTFLFVKKPEDYIKYTIIMLIANAGGYTANIFYTLKYVPLNLSRHLNLKEHIKAILYLFGIALTVQIYVKSDVAILGFLRSDSEVGIYTIASKVYTIVKSLLNAVITVTIPRLAVFLGENDKTAYSKLLVKLKSWLVAIVFPCVIGLLMVSNNVMQLIGDDEYISGSDALRILCIALAFAVFGCYYSNGIMVVQKQEKIFFIATIISALENIILNIILIPRWGMNAAAFTTVLAEGIVIGICKHYSREYDYPLPRRDYISVIVGCIGIAIICRLLTSAISKYWLALILSIICSIVVYGTCLAVFRNSIVEEVNSIIKKKIR